MIYLKSAVIVEGKYDKIKLSSFIDALIITTDGFGVFNNKEKLDFIRKLAKENGIIIMTDSDNAGMLIRNNLKSRINEGSIKNVLLPQISGKERRKSEYSKDGFLGVEGLSEEVIIKALEKSGCVGQKCNENFEKLSKSDLFSLGLSGTKDSKERRTAVYKEMGLPKNLSANLFLEYVNTNNRINEFMKAVEICRCSQDKE